MHILVVDIGGTNVKVWKTGESDKVKIPSGPDLTPQGMVDAIRKECGDWKFDRVSIGYPGEIRHGKPLADPYALAPGWIDFNYGDAFEVPVRLMNDACMQALGSYDGGHMLYIGLGTNMGTTLVLDRRTVPLALGHLQFRKKTFNDYLSRAGREKMDDDAEWQKAVYEAAETLKNAFMVDYVMLGGGNAKKLEDLPGYCRRGGNQNAYFGGLRMWEDGALAGN